MSLISVIVCVYNDEEHIKCCLSSLLQQTFHDIEILCIDDGSTDRTIDILHYYKQKDSRIRLIGQKNEGIGVARNKGLYSSNSPYIMFCDSDDWYEPTMCEKMYKGMHSNDVDLVCCSCSLEFSDNVFGRNRAAMKYLQKAIHGKIRITSAVKQMLNVVVWNKIFKRSLIQKYGISFPNIREHEDDSFVSQYLYVSNYIYGLAEPLYHHSLHEKSLMTTYWQDPDRADKWTHLQSWRHTGEFLIHKLQMSQFPSDYIEQFFTTMDLMRKTFSWKHFSDADIEHITGFLQGFPLHKEDSLEYPLWACQQGDFSILETRLNSVRKELRISGITLYSKEQNWRETRVFLLGMELYKRDFIMKKMRILGLIKFKI